MGGNQTNQARILIVDDNPANILLLEEMLEQEGYDNLMSTTDSRQVRYLHLKWRFDLILLDLKMPHLDGIQVMDRLADTVRNDYLPILVITADTDRNLRLRAIEKGAKDYITKPFEIKEALYRIRNMLEVRALYNERRWRAECSEAIVRRRNEEVRETQLEIIRRLSRAGEYRDNETGMHVIRMSKYAQRLAQAAGLGEEISTMILHASPMHDVGKIGIPDRILLKPGRLDPEEWEIMKSHVEIGATILDGRTSDIIQMARVIVLSHHEKWDGTGYPRQLKGEDIPIEGRITAVCDVFDALTSDRPYKKAWSIEAAVEEIKRGAGFHFAPGLVDVFVGILPKILRVRDCHADPKRTKAPALAFHPQGPGLEGYAYG